MAPTIFAPVLSATSRMDLIWIMALALHLGPGNRRVDRALLEDRDEAPPLRLRERARLGDLDAVALLGVALLVVGVALGVLLEELAEARIADDALDLDDDGLVHLVADDAADDRLAIVTRRRGGPRSTSVARLQGRLGVRGHPTLRRRKNEPGPP